MEIPCDADQSALFIIHSHAAEQRLRNRSHPRRMRRGEAAPVVDDMREDHRKPHQHRRIEHDLSSDEGLHRRSVLAGIEGCEPERFPLRNGQKCVDDLRPEPASPKAVDGRTDPPGLQKDMFAGNDAHRDPVGEIEDIALGGDLLSAAGAGRAAVPVEVVRKMGADLVIAVNLDADYFADNNSENNKFGFYKMAENSINLLRHHLAYRNVENADIVISPRVGNAHWGKFLDGKDIISAGEKATKIKRSIWIWNAALIRMNILIRIAIMTLVNMANI